MADTKITESLQRLDQLTPEARQRVQDALQSHIESELSAGPIGPNVNKAAEFSRGIIFSRSRPTSMLDHEKEVINQAAKLDEATFAKFAKNISQLKSTKGPGGGGGGG
jgi:hypothetical protein